MAIHIRRREFIVALGGAAAWPFAARAQDTKQNPTDRGAMAQPAATFEFMRQGLRERGYIETKTSNQRVRIAKFDVLVLDIATFPQALAHELESCRRVGP